MVANIDLAPSIAEMANVKTADFIDGRSFVPLLQPEMDPNLKWRNNLLIELGYSEKAFSTHQNVDLAGSVISTPVAEYPDTSSTNLVQIEGGTSRGIRGEDFIYVEYDNGELEFYDLIADPYQLENIANQIDPQILAQLHTRLEQLKYCTKDDCRKYDTDLTIDFRK
jgi:arylsulfatase A-like enzyme